MPGYQIALRCGLSSASVSRILRRARLSRWRDLHPRPPIVRYEHAAPGDLLHLDIKGMTRFSEVSLRGDGRLRGKRKHPGFQALHVAVDDHSRLAFTQMLPDQKAETTIAFLHDAREFFARHGIGVRALLTDNGSCTAHDSSATPATACRLSIAAPDPTRPRPTEKPSASSKLPCANGPMPNTGIAPTSATNTCNPGTITTTSKDLMVASTTNHPSAAPTSEQPLDLLQPPAQNNPLTYVDPLGLDQEIVCMGGTCTFAGLEDDGDGGGDGDGDVGSDGGMGGPPMMAAGCQPGQAVDQFGQCYIVNPDGSLIPVNGLWFGVDDGGCGMSGAFCQLSYQGGASWNIGVYSNYRAPNSGPSYTPEDVCAASALLRRVFRPCLMPSELFRSKGELLKRLNLRGPLFCRSCHVRGEYSNRCGIFWNQSWTFRHR